MKKALFATMLVCATMFAATDKLGNSNDPQIEPCTFDEGSKSCSREFTLPAFKTADGSFSPWIYNIVITPPKKYIGWLQWHVYVFDGDEWIDQGLLTYTPYDHSQTTVTASASLKIRVTVKVVLGRAPAEDKPVVIGVYAAQREDFVAGSAKNPPDR